MFLADMGAETIRVETVNHLPATSRGPFARPNKESQLTALSSPYPDRDPGDRPWNRAANFNAHSRNKSGMTLELGQPEAKDIFRRLVEVSDLFIENNAAGSMARLGVSWDVVSKWNPRLIMISVCGFGQTGPWSEYRGIGTQFEAAVGHASVSGYPDMGIDGAPGSVATDASSGVTVAIAAMLAPSPAREDGQRHVRRHLPWARTSCPTWGSFTWTTPSTGALPGLRATATGGTCRAHTPATATMSGSL